MYSNAEGIEWVEELAYTAGGQIGEISRQTDKAVLFRNGTANRLPVGTKIYETDTPVCMAVVDGRNPLYLKMVEWGGRILSTGMTNPILVWCFFIDGM
ncbi:hypothetical protein QRD89_07400 [Halobacillus sp. ACCC02827]|uniref:hypothetical protein n=1 Tax=Halobacillus sp. ACCC02827 TaxID=3052090 RepID=UPI00256FACF7|nr:hypothetical protein [Halobacillus sp. ACCC02827]WJE17168.1 hypothetical protein QRD89_07400 [Halobacillus sp. ACCC02827]